MNRKPAPYYFAENALFRAVIGVGRMLRYERRVWLGGAAARQFAVASGAGERVLRNLEYIFPDMPRHRRIEIMHGCADNLGRFFSETYSTGQFLRRAARIIPEGPGIDLVKEACSIKRPVILVSGHFGNFQAVRALLLSAGVKVAAIYKPARNPYFNPHYMKTISALGNPLFPVGKDRAGLVRFIKDGGVMGLLNDQHAGGGELLEFMGKPAKTNILVARIAIKYDALLLPCYATRLSNGIDFRVEFEAPVELGDPLKMTQALNDSLEARVRKHMDQYHWFHNRWKCATESPALPTSAP